MKIFSDMQLKILALVFAVALWFYVQGRDVVETAVKFNILFSDIHSSLYIEETSVSEVQLWVKAPKHMIDKLLNSDKKVELSLKQFAKPQDKAFITINQERFNLSAPFEITRIQPEKIWVKLSPFMQKKVRIAANYSGRKPYRISPTTIVIKGDRKIVEKITTIYTDVIDSQDEEKKEVSVKLIVPAEKVYLNRDEVTITFK